MSYRIVFSFAVFLLAQANINAANIAAFLDPNTHADPNRPSYLDGEKVVVKALLIDSGADNAKITVSLRSPVGEVTESVMDFPTGWQINTVVTIFSQEVTPDLADGEYNLVVRIEDGSRLAKLAHHYSVRRLTKKRFPRYANFSIANGGEKVTIGVDGVFLNPGSRSSLYTRISYWIGDPENPESGHVFVGTAANFRTLFLQVPSHMLEEGSNSRILFRVPLSELSQPGEVEEAFGTGIRFTAIPFRTNIQDN